METLAIGMQNLRIAQLLSHEERPTTADSMRLEEGLNFIRRSLAAVLYLHEGRAEGLEPVALTEAKYTSSTVRRLQLATDYPSFRRYLEDLAQSLQTYLESQKTLTLKEREHLERFFEFVGESMVSEVLEGSDDSGETVEDQVAPW